MSDKKIVKPIINKIMKSSRKTKKYMVNVKFPNKRGYKLIHFGARGMAQFKDKTPLKLYSSMDHLDKKRKDNYYSRFGKTNDKTSPMWWSHRYLW